MISDWTKSESRFRLLAFLAILGSIGPHVSLADTPRAAQKSMSGEAPATSPEVARMLSDAREAIRTGNLPLAIIQLKNAVNAAPRNGLVRVQLALADLMGGNYPDAESQLRQARIDHAPDQAVLPPLFDAMLARGEAQQLLAEFPDPGPHAKESSAPDVLKARAVALLRVGQPQQAVAEMDQSLAYRRDVSGLLTRAKIAQEEKDIGTAQKLADEALGRDSKSLDALVFEISLAMQSRHDAQALALAERLVHDYPDNLAARSARIEVYLKQKMDAKAKPEVDAILAVHPTLPAAVYYRAILLARAGRTRDAWGVAESLPPEFVQAQAGTAMAVAELAAANKDYETAGAILASALAKHPDDLNIRLRLAATRLQQNSAENALNILLPMKDSGDPRLQSLLAETYLKLHRWSDALAYLEKAAAVPGVSPLLKEQLAETQMQVGQEDTRS